ncbi:MULTISPECIES: iron ABC transporter permease [Cobetia]|nr:MULTISPECIES: iron ABC transporter permease [Cobetia]MDI4660167.1 iron ABC transporter permease [Cobetia sp. BMC6]MDL2192262.1 iron ABC transporter permease [Cobetia sp. LC6]NUJ56382.1 iron ABC transporter permease [Cobetia marina]
MSPPAHAQASAPESSPTLAQQYRRFAWKRVVILSALCLALLLAILGDIMTGPADLALSDLLGELINPGSHGPINEAIVWQIRLPTAVMAALVGAALGLAGAEMQTVLNNALASPFTLGVGAAATLGASLVIILDVALPGLPPSYTIALMAFVFAALSILAIDAVASLYGASREVIVLFGIALVFVLNAVNALVQFVASPDALQQLVFWTMGSLSEASWERVAIIASVLVVCLPFAMRRAWALTALRAGEDHARSFGVPVTRLRRTALLRVSLLAAVAVAFVGTIGFIGLVGPHMARLALGEDHRFYLPGSALAGALVLSLAATASESLVPGLVLPVGIVTSLIGIPCFLALLLGQRRGQG